MLLSLAVVGRSVRADDTNTLNPAAAETNSAVAKPADARPSGPDTNSPALRALDTNSLILTPIDTNSPGFSNPETNPASVRKAPSTVRFDLDSFRVISERNIFNPNRRPFRGGRPPRPEREDPGARMESFALIGTLSYEKGDFAFFEGSSSQYRKVLQPDETIAGYRIAEIAPNFVKLAGTNGQAIELAIGREMRKGGEDWRLAERPDAIERPATSDTTSNTNTVGASSEKTEPASTSAESDVLKRLLEKRAQELNK